MSVYGYCEDCKMELTALDTRNAPPGVCENCFGLDLYQDYNAHPNDYKQMPIYESLWFAHPQATEETSEEQS